MMEASSDESDELQVETVTKFEPYMYEPLATVNSQLSESECDDEEDEGDLDGELCQTTQRQQEVDCSADDATGAW